MEVLIQVRMPAHSALPIYISSNPLQVFPDDYHLATLDTFLSSCSQLQVDSQYYPLPIFGLHLYNYMPVQAKVCTKDIVISLMSRLSNYALNSPELIPSELEMFPLFQEHSKTIIQSKEMSLSDVLSLQASFIHLFALSSDDCDYRQPSSILHRKSTRSVFPTLTMFLVFSLSLINGVGLRSVQDSLLPCFKVVAVRLYRRRPQVRDL